MSDFKLRKFVRTVFNDSTVTDPESLAKEVLAQLPAEDERAALEQAMRMVAQNFLTHARGSLTSLGGQTPHGTYSAAAAGGRTSSKSWKTRGSREFWRKRLEELYCGGPDQTWLSLGDCDVAALARLAERGDMLAAANAKTAAEAREWAALLERHHVDTVRQLPEDVLRERLQGGAAA